MGLSDVAKFVRSHVDVVYQTAHSIVYVYKSDPQTAIKSDAIWIEGRAYGRVSQPRNTSYHLRREYTIYQALGEHRLIVACCGLAETEKDDAWALRLERAPDGDLRRHIIGHPAPSMKSRLRMAVDFADGVQHMHDCGVVWGDLSTRNALLFSSSRIKLCDFAGSILRGVYPDLDSFAYETRYFPALPDRECPALGSMELELSALGSAVYEITEWTMPYGTQTPEQNVYKKLHRRERPFVSDDNPARDIIVQCWDLACPSAQAAADALREAFSQCER